MVHYSTHRDALKYNVQLTGYESPKYFTMIYIRWAQNIEVYDSRHCTTMTNNTSTDDAHCKVKHTSTCTYIQVCVVSNNFGAVLYIFLC